MKEEVYEMLDAYDSADSFIKFYNKRRINANDWYWWVGTIRGKEVSVKSYRTWNQRIRVDGIHVPTVHDLNIKGWKAELLEALSDESQKG